MHIGFKPIGENCDLVKQMLLTGEEVKAAQLYDCKEVLRRERCVNLR